MPPSTAIPNQVPIANSELHQLYSTHVGQEYQIKIRLPEAYHSSAETYPVLYLPDGDHIFAMATDIVQYLLYGQLVPDLIIVSPAYGSKNSPELGGTNMRNRDLLPFPQQDMASAPGAAAFLAFFEHELIPFVERTFRVAPHDRTLFGYSFGALFVLFALFTKPTLFTRYIAIDGFADEFWALEEQYAQTHQALPAKLFLAPANAMSPLAEKLTARQYDQLTIHHTDLSSADHFAIPGESLTKGLIWSFQALPAPD
jgi:enterochelin esterase-like enzyme